MITLMNPKIGSAPELLHDKYYLHGRNLRKGDIVEGKTEEGDWVRARFGCGKNPNTGEPDFMVDTQTARFTSC